MRQLVAATPKLGAPGSQPMVPPPVLCAEAEGAELASASMAAANVIAILMVITP